MNRHEESAAPAAMPSRGRATPRRGISVSTRPGWGPAAREKKLTSALLISVLLALRPAAQIPTDSWPTYNGDYSGRRYSTLSQINKGNVKALSLAWVYRLNTSRAGAILGGEGPDTVPPAAAPPAIK